MARLSRIRSVSRADLTQSLLGRVLCGVATLGLAACTPPVDLKQALRIEDLSGGWYDEGLVDGKNKLVPTVTFRATMIGDVNVTPISMNVLFRAIDGRESELDQDVFVQRLEFEGNATAPVVVRAPNGYLGEGDQTRAQMLSHSQFRDLRATIYAKHSSSQWIELATYDIPRKMLAK